MEVVIKIPLVVLSLFVLLAVSAMTIGMAIAFTLGAMLICVVFSPFAVLNAMKSRSSDLKDWFDFPNRVYNKTCGFLPTMWREWRGALF